MNNESRQISVIVSRQQNDAFANAFARTPEQLADALKIMAAAAVMQQQQCKVAQPATSARPDASMYPAQQLLLQQQQSQPRTRQQPALTVGALLKAAMRNRTGSTAPAACHSMQQQQTSSTASGSPNRMSYPREFKLLVISYYFNNGQNKYRTCKEFQITKSMLNGWLQKVDKIQQSRPGSLKSGRSGRKPQFPQVETELYGIYLSYLSQGKKVGNRWLRDTAKCIAQRRCTTEELSGMCQFSERWLCNFKKRFGINLTKDWNDKPASSSGSTLEAQQRKISPVASSVDTSQLSPDTTTMPNEHKADSPPLDLSISSKCKIDPIVQTAREPTNQIAVSPAPVQTAREPQNHHETVNAQSGKRGRKVQFPQVEKALFKKLRDKQIDGNRVSNRWLQDEARRLAVELCPHLFTDTFKSARCMFSEHWLHNFKKRYGVTLKQGSTIIQNEATTTVSPEMDMVTSTEDLAVKIENTQAQIKEEPAEKTQMETGNQNRLDDLPTMVPLPVVCKALPPAIDFTEWYSKITTFMNNNRQGNVDTVPQ